MPRSELIPKVTALSKSGPAQSSAWRLVSPGCVPEIRVLSSGTAVSGPRTDEVSSEHAVRKRETIARITIAVFLMMSARRARNYIVGLERGKIF